MDCFLCGYIYFRCSDVVCNSLLDIGKDGLDLLQSIDFPDFVLSSVNVNDRNLLLAILGQSLTESLNVVVGASRVGTALHNALDEGLFFNDEVKHASEVDGVSHDLVPSLIVVLIAREAVNKELFRAPALLLHGCLDEAASDGDRYNLAILDNLVDEGGLLRATGHLCAQKIAGGEMHKTIGLD